MIDVRSYAGSRYAKNKDFNAATLDAPDLATRRAMMKREAGQATGRDNNRIATRMSVEQETNRTGGIVRQPITPKKITPYQQGQTDRDAEDGYAAGYEGRPRTPAAPAVNPMNPVNPVAPVGPAAAAANPGASQRNPVNPGIDVRSYSGSRYAQPDASGAAPGVPPPSAPGGVQVRNYAGTGTQPAPDDNATRTPTEEETADAILRSRFGKPPNERGEIDVSSAKGNRSIKARRY